MHITVSLPLVSLMEIIFVILSLRYIIAAVCVRIITCLYKSQNNALLKAIFFFLNILHIIFLTRDSSRIVRENKENFILSNILAQVLWMARNISVKIEVCDSGIRYRSLRIEGNLIVRSYKRCSAINHDAALSRVARGSSLGR